MIELKNATEKEYYSKVHFWGRLTLLLSMLSLIGMPLYLSFGLGYHPGWDKILLAFMNIAAVVGHVWINVADQMTYVLLMGPAATYMSSLTGNIKDIRLPCAMAATSDLDENTGRAKRDILATFGVLVSVVINTLTAIVLIFAGSYISEILPPKLLAGLGHIIPALFGAVFAQFALIDFKAALISLPIVIVVYNLPFIPSPIRTFAAIVFTIAANITVHKLRKKRDDQTDPS